MTRFNMMAMAAIIQEVTTPLKLNKNIIDISYIVKDSKMY